MPWWAEYLLWGLCAISGYELVRYLIVSYTRRRLSDGAASFVRRHNVRLESARFIDRIWMREKLAQDPAIEEAIAAEARRSGDSVYLLRRKADAYLEEIAPYFSMSAYYRFGAAMAKLFVNFCFELVVDNDEFDRQAAKVPEDAVRVYVINHRSNTDSIVISYGLLRQVALSYATGEWALVWPVHSIFRRFGSYFVRRGEKDPLYHAVLERFVQVLAGHGGVTGFYIEGGLSRDGGLRPAKAGLLDYLIRLRHEQPDREIYFLPVGLNYDRTLEDRTLVAERDGPLPKATIRQRMTTIAGIGFWLPILVTANVLRVATRSHRKFGYAAVSFGEPLRLLDWEGGETVHAIADRHERRAKVAEMATHLLNERIGEVIPATPVPLLCTAMLAQGPNTSGQLQKRVAEVVRELRDKGRPVALGRAFDTIRERRSQPGVASVPGLDDELLDAEEAELIVVLARTQLERRGVVVKNGSELEMVDGEQPILEYYANSIRHHFEAPAQ